MKLLHLKRRFYEARLTAYEAALRAMKRTFGAWSEAFSGFIHHFCRRQKWWAMRDSNPRHSRCKRDALTNWANRPWEFNGLFLNISPFQEKIKSFFEDKKSFPSSNMLNIKKLACCQKKKTGKTAFQKISRRYLKSRSGKVWWLCHSPNLDNDDQVENSGAIPFMFLSRTALKRSPPLPE